MYVADLNGENKKLINAGHHDGETWGLDVHDNFIFTCGDDNKIMLWDWKEKKFLAKGIMAEQGNKSKKATASTLSAYAVNQ